MAISRVGFRLWPAAAACAALCAPPAPAAEDMAQWAHSADVYLNTLPDGANVTDAVRNFPVLLRLDGALFDFSQARGKGQDVRFTKADGTPLAYEIERWDSAAAAAAVWVRIDTVLGNSADQSFKMRWGMPTAPDNSDGPAVFDTADGYAAVWHLGGGAAVPRANSAAGGLPAAPLNYDGDESRPGMAGLCDSLDGAAAGDYLDLGDGYADFSGGFTYTVWTNPASAASYGKLLDIGNGTGIDNIALFRVAGTADLAFKNWNGTDTSKRVVAAGALALNQWQLIGLTVSGKQVRIYRNGSLAATDSIANTLANKARLSNFLGRSNWTSNAYFAGKFDEPWIARTARGADWMRLAYANQKPDQNLVSFVKPVICAASFAAPADTSVSEATSLELTATADCAAGFTWIQVSGPPIGILDPDNKRLQIYLPRVDRDTTLVFRFTAHYDSDRVRDVKVTLRNLIPDPVFTLAAPKNWNGSDSLVLAPDIANLAAIEASRDSTLAWDWSLGGLAADTAWMAGGLRLLKCGSQGNLTVTLCLSNGGEPVCRTAELSVGAATGLRTARDPRRQGPRARFRDLRGRLLPAGKPAGYVVPSLPVKKE
jgi:hypothetical protein